MWHNGRVVKHLIQDFEQDTLSILLSTGINLGRPVHNTHKRAASVLIMHTGI